MLTLKTTLRTLGLVSGLLLMQACGQQTDSAMAKAINDANQQNQQKQADNKDVTSGNDAQSSDTQVEVKTTVTIKNSQSADIARKDVLQGSWISMCDNGIRHLEIFNSGIFTIVTYVYEDTTQCSGNPQSFTQRTTYKIVGDNGVSFGGAEVVGFTIDNNTLTFDSDLNTVYTKTK